MFTKNKAYATQRNSSTVTRSAISAKTTLGIAAALAAIALPTLGQATTWPTYVVYKIPLVSGQTNWPMAVNSYNEVAGYSNTPTPGLQLGLLGGVNSPSIQVGLPPNSDYMRFLAMNDSPLAVGFAHSNNYPQAITYRTGQTPQRIFIPNTTLVGSECVSVNHSGVTVGALYENLNGQLHRYMFRFDVNAHALTGVWPDSYAGAINDDGLVATAPFNPFIPGLPVTLNLDTDPNTGDFYYAPTGFEQLLPASISTEGGVAVVGDALTNSLNNSGTHRQGFLFTQFNKFWYTMADPSGSGFETDPMAVDYWGQLAVGFSADKQGNHTAIGWANPQTHMSWIPAKLQTVFGNPAGWTFSEATGISAIGAISGFGTFNGIKTGFVAVPVHQYGFDVASLTIVGGAKMNGTLKMETASPYALTFEGATSNLAATLPAHMVTPAGLSPQTTFTIQSHPVDSATPVELAVQMGGTSSTVHITVETSKIKNLVLASDTIGSGQTVQATLNLTGPAGPSGKLVRLSCPNNLVHIPSTLRIAPGASSATFNVTVGEVRGLETTDLIALLADEETRTKIHIGRG